MLADGARETVVSIPLNRLHPFKGYGSMPRQPYQVRDDDPVMQQIAATVRERGVRQPGLVRPDPEGGYEIVAGHRRFRACELAGLDAMPVIVRDMSDEEAVAELVCSNIQRENVLPSERAWAYKIRQRQAEGIAAAKARGVRFGRPPAPLPENFHGVYQRWRAGKITGADAARECGMSLPTFRYRARVYENAKFSP